MDTDDFFERIVQPGSVLLGFFGFVHEVDFDGRRFVVSHKVSKNILTEFDNKLSRYLAAMRGHGLPGAAVETTIRDTEEDRIWQPYPPRYVRSLPEALATALRLALGSEPWVRVRLGVWMSEGEALDSEHILTGEAVRAMEHAVDICQQIGPAEFLEISGDMHRLLVRPRDAKLDMLVMDMERGTISVPATSELAGVAYQGPLFGFDRAIRQHPAVGTYLSRARYHVSLAKEEAIYAFREEAEGRIMEFDSALAGRELAGHRLESARSLVARLQAGLGDTLLGLSEAAQLTALDWASEVQEVAEVKAIEGSDGTGAPRRPRLVR